MAMAGELAGQVALVTGGGRGIGRGIAEAFAAAGAAVAVMARSHEQLQETVASITNAGGRALAVRGDVSVRSDVERAVAETERQLGPITVLVNNAGITGPFAPIWEADPDEWWRTQEVHLHGAFLCTRTVLPGMIARGGGRIITVASRAAEQARPNVSAYGVAKTAQLRFTETLAAEAGPHGIRAFVLHPGFVDTQFADEPLKRADAQRWVPEFVQRLTELKKNPAIGTPLSRVTGLCVFLASGRGDALSGRYLTVDDDVEELARRAETIRQADLYTLRLRTLREWAGNRADVQAGERIR
jgi:NAD(P)-dependent dehydrogenase (short-subunit alcohol dehydrogenase family)